MAEGNLKEDPYFHFKGGPHGLGDPDDLRLRKVEREIMIPKLMRAIAQKEKCIKEVADFENCCKCAKYSMIYKCRRENDSLWQCLENWYQNEEFKGYCTQQYLKERSEFRRTGIRTKSKQKLPTAGM